MLGQPPYYERFGFSVEAARPFASPYPAEFMMALELRPDGLAEALAEGGAGKGAGGGAGKGTGGGAGGGELRYPAAFAALD